MNALLGLAGVRMFRGDFTGARLVVEESLAAMQQAVPVARSAGFAYGVVIALEFFCVLRL